jgi:hypothetical protein
MFATLKSACNSKVKGFLALSLILVCFGASASAQVTTATANASDTSFYVGYYGNANIGFPDATVTVVNPTSVGYGPNGGSAYANIYVFTSDQEMVECCSCYVSANGILQLSLAALTANPLTGAPPTAGAIKVDSSTTTYDAASVIPNGSLRIWDTHVRETVGGSSPLFTVTEVPLPQAVLSYTELEKLRNSCNSIEILGSGYGSCQAACPTFED